MRWRCHAPDDDLIPIAFTQLVQLLIELHPARGPLLEQVELCRARLQVAHAGADQADRSSAVDLALEQLPQGAGQLVIAVGREGKRRLPRLRVERLVSNF